jgi:predicted GTPase
MPKLHDFNAKDDSYSKEYDTEKIPVNDEEVIIKPIRDCPKFRILIVGQTGVGKSTILSKVFKITDLQVGFVPLE